MSCHDFCADSQKGRPEGISGKCVGAKAQLHSPGGGLQRGLILAVVALRPQGLLLWNAIANKSLTTNASQPTAKSAARSLLCFSSRLICGIRHTVNSIFTVKNEFRKNHIPRW